jgi:hypothetical protein
MDLEMKEIQFNLEMKEIQFKLPAALAVRLEARAAALGLELGDLVELMVLRDLEGGDLSAVVLAELAREKERLRPGATAISPLRKGSIVQDGVPK